MKAPRRNLMLDEIEFGGDAAYFPEHDVLVVSDLHIGLEQALHDEGMSMPLGERETLQERLRGVLERFSPGTVVFNGDVHHSFGRLGDAADTITSLRDMVVERGIDPVFIEGNHDTMLDAVVDTRDRYLVENTLFIHGHEIPVDLPDAGLYVVGHDHPTLEIEMQKTKCYLYGPFDDGDVLMTPAFNPLCRGVVVNKMESRDFMSPFIRGDFGEFRVMVESDDDVLRFPRIREFRDLM